MVESKNMKRIHQFLLVMTRQCLFMFCQVTATILLASSTTGDCCDAANGHCDAATLASSLQ